MTAHNPTALKLFFETGDKPTSSQFGDVMDSYVNVVQTSAQTIISDVSALGKLDVAGNGTFKANIAVSGVSTLTGGIVGTATNNNAAVGQIGEFISSTVLVGAAIPLTTATPANVTSISLTAGDWDVEGTVISAMIGGTTMTSLAGWISSTSAVVPTAPNSGSYLTWNGSLAGVSNNISFSVGRIRFSLSSTTTIYLSSQSSFSGSTNAAYGFIGARRAR